MFRPRLVTRLLVLGALTCGMTAAAPPAPDANDDHSINPRWLEKLPPADASALKPIIGYAPPAFDERLQWFESDPLRWADLRGKVVVIQSWSHRSAARRQGLTRAKRIVAGFEGEDVVLIALHTPESVDRAEAYLERKKMGMPVVVDPIGAYCDELGVYKRPVNFLVDRQGAVRAAGLNAPGLKAMIEKLRAEDYDPEQKPQAMPEPDEAGETAAPAQFPPFGNTRVSAKDIRGKRAPNFQVDEWLTSQPNATGKVVVIDFWATWCSPCRNSIPHMNELATRFADDMVVVGLSDENKQAFENGMRKHDLRLTNFRYSLALDQRGRMKGEIKVSGIPHAIVMSSDWIVRWQGNPATLKADTLERIVKANRQLNAGSASAQRKRWTGS